MHHYQAFQTSRQHLLAERLIERAFPAIFPNLPDSKTMAPNFKEMPCFFRNQSYQEVTPACSPQYSMFPASLSEGVSEGFHGVPRWHQQTLEIVSSTLTKTQMPIRSPLTPDLRDTSARADQTILIFDRKETVLTFRFPQPGPALIKAPTNPASESVLMEISMYPAGFPPFAKELSIPPNSPINLDRLMRASDFFPPVFRMAGYTPCEAWFHIPYKKFTLATFHSVVFKIAIADGISPIAEKTALVGNAGSIIETSFKFHPTKKLSSLYHFRADRFPEFSSSRTSLKALCILQWKSVASEPYSKPLIPEPVSQLVRFDIIGFQMDKTPLHARRQTPKAIFPDRQLQMKKPSVVDVLYKNLVERWIMLINQPLPFRLKKRETVSSKIPLPRSVKPVGTEIALQTRPLGLHSHIKFFPNRGWRIMTARLRDLLHVAKQSSEAPQRFTSPGNRP